MKDIKILVEKIVEYTRNWSITETEWYWNVESVRKSNYVNEKHIKWEEFEVAIREEILYDLIFNEGCCTLNQLENDVCNYESDNIEFQKASKELEKEIQKFIEDFEVERYEG